MAAAHVTPVPRPAQRPDPGVTKMGSCPDAEPALALKNHVVTENTRANSWEVVMDELKNSRQQQVAEDLAREQVPEDLDVNAQDADEVTGGKLIDKASPVLLTQLPPPPPG